jgi:hypothetical protein
VGQTAYTSPNDHDPRATADLGTKHRLPSPTSSVFQAIDTETSSDCSEIDGSSRDILPTLTEITFRPQSSHICSFTAVVQDVRDGRGVSFSQLARLIESIGHVGKIDDFTIKPLQQQSFLVTGFSRSASPRLSSSRTTLSTAIEAHPIHDDATRARLQHGIARKAVALQGITGASSDDSGLSDSDPGPNSDNDRCSNRGKQDRSSTRKNIP